MSNTARSTSWVLAARVLLISLGVVAATSAVILGRGGNHRRPVVRAEDRKEDRPSNHLGWSASARFACPMHGAVQASEPGNCPICGMALNKIYKQQTTEASRAAGAGDGGASVTISADIGNRLRYDIIVARRHVFTGGVRAPAWVHDGRSVVALLYNDEIATLDPAESGTFFSAAAPATAVAVRAAGDPATPWDLSRAEVRFLLSSATMDRPGGGTPLARGEVGWLRLAARPRQVLVAPEEALVTNTVLGPCLVGVTSDNRTYTLLPIRIGKVIDGLVTVVSGVEDQQRILGRDVFFLDAERRRTGGAIADPPAGGQR
jgi:hypothetical protein